MWDKFIVSFIVLWMFIISVESATGLCEQARIFIVFVIYLDIKFLCPIVKACQARHTQQKTARSIPRTHEVKSDSYLEPHLLTLQKYGRNVVKPKNLKLKVVVWL